MKILRPNASSVVKLRGHHLLCILNYGGAGYTPEFIENMSSVVERINQGAAIQIVSGIDDICAVLRQGGAVACAHARTCRAQRVKHRDEIALQSVTRALSMPKLKIGSLVRFTKKEVTKLRRFFALNAIRNACTGCEWHARCSERAESNFVGAKLFPPEKV